jgi:hypothetical protein
LKHKIPGNKFNAEARLFIFAFATGKQWREKESTLCVYGSFLKGIINNASQFNEILSQIFHIIFHRALIYPCVSAGGDGFRELDAILVFKSRAPSWY